MVSKAIHQREFTCDVCREATLISVHITRPHQWGHLQIVTDYFDNPHQTGPKEIIEDLCPKCTEFFMTIIEAAIEKRQKSFEGIVVPDHDPGVTKPKRRRQPPKPTLKRRPKRSDWSA